jgi:hypothetical protein
MVHEVNGTFGYLVAELQVLRFLLLELVSLIRRLQKHRARLLLVGHPEVGVLIIDLEGEHPYYEGSIEDWADLIVDEEGGVEVEAWPGLQRPAMCLWVCIISLQGRQDHLLEEVVVDCKEGVLGQVLKFH